MDNYFKELYAIDVNDRTYQKKDLTYLSWCSAWSELKKLHPDATFEFKKFKDVREVTATEFSETGNIVKQTKSITEQYIPYIETDLGLTVYTSVTVNEITHEMELTVMDGANKAMKSQAYTYSTKYGDKTVEAATMFDVNKAIMRCLTKNIAMHGVGLYIYEKDSLPEAVVEIQKKDAELKEINAESFKIVLEKSKISEEMKNKVADICGQFVESRNPKEIKDLEKANELNKQLKKLK